MCKVLKFKWLGRSGVNHGNGYFQSIFGEVMMNYIPRCYIHVFMTCNCVSNLIRGDFPRGFFCMRASIWDGGQADQANAFQSLVEKK